MYEARISFENGRKHTIEANTIESLKSKCEIFIKNDKVYLIEMIKVENIGWLKIGTIFDED